MAEALRDFRHALQFFTQQRLNFAPKTKFLYHCSFALTDEAKGIAQNTDTNIRVLNVLPKSVDLPGFSASVETKQQYNRKKNIQTRIDYDPVSITFHDDNADVSYNLFKEYYKYYFVDGQKTSTSDWGARNKYEGEVSKYGLDNGRNKPFFSSITIFQMSRQRWTSYTLINPLVEKWQHDTMDASEGGGIAENRMTVVYEGVIYNEGNVEALNNPTGFADESTGYDYTPSPWQGDMENYYSSQGQISTSTSLINNRPQPAIPQQSSNSNSVPAPGNDAVFRTNQTDPGGYPNITFPTNNNAAAPVTTTNEQNRSTPLTGEAVRENLEDDPELLDAFVRKALQQGQVRGYDISNYGDFNDLPDEEQEAIRSRLLNGLSGGNRRLTNIGNVIINRSRRNSSTA